MTNIDRETLLTRILSLYAVGYGSSAIARRLTQEGTSVSHETVQTLIREEAAAMRARNEGLVEEARLQQDHAIMALYRAVVDSMLGEDGVMRFCEKAVKCAILLMERRSRLLGLDKLPAPIRAGANDWLKNASRDQLETMAADMGIVFPKPFVG